MVLVDQLLGVENALGGIITVIIDNQPNFSTENAAFFIELFDIALGAADGVGAQETGVSAERTGRANPKLRIGDARGL